VSATTARPARQRTSSLQSRESADRKRRTKTRNRLRQIIGNEDTRDTGNFQRCRPIDPVDLRSRPADVNQLHLQRIVEGQIRGVAKRTGDPIARADTLVRAADPVRVHPCSSAAINGSVFIRVHPCSSAAINGQRSSVAVIVEIPRPVRPHRECAYIHRIAEIARKTVLDFSARGMRVRRQ
jgi:hypothetical protein